MGQQYKQPIPANGGKLRITAQGLEFLDALNNDTVFHKIKDFSLGIATDIGKDLLKVVICRALGIS